MQSLDHLKVRNIEIFVFGRVEIFLCYKDTLCDRLELTKRAAFRLRKRTLEKVFVDDAPVLF